MSAGPRRFIFNRYQAPDQVAIPDFYADDPIIQLDEGQEFLRSARQGAALHSNGKPGPSVSDPIFGDGLDWAYREYIVHVLTTPGANGDAMIPPGNDTSQLVDADTRRHQIEKAQIVDRPANDHDL